MFICVLCPGTFTEQDVKEGIYFPSTGVCLSCYIKLAKSQSSCFGEKSKYNLRIIACQECLDNKICKAFVHHRKDFIPKEKIHGRRSR